MDFFKTIKESRSKVAKFGTTVSCKYFCTADRQDSKAGSVLILKVFVFLEGRRREMACLFFSSNSPLTFTLPKIIFRNICSSRKAINAFKWQPACPQISVRSKKNAFNLSKDIL